MINEAHGDTKSGGTKHTSLYRDGGVKHAKTNQTHHGGNNIIEERRMGIDTSNPKISDKTAMKKLLNEPSSCTNKNEKLFLQK